jgi:hypothetical protein
VVAVLFYATDTDAVMGTDGVMSDGRNTKILWLLDGIRGPLSVVGTEASSEETFEQTWHSDAAQHATHVDVPSPGCWTLTASIAGMNAGSVTIRVEGR